MKDYATDDAAEVADLVDVARSIMQVAQKCDALCLGVGGLLGDAIPTLNTLSERFKALSEILETGSMYEASRNLEGVVGDVRDIGIGLACESNSLTELIRLNLAMSLVIANVADDVRFLVAMVSNAKVELASIDDQGEGLDSFGQTLELLALNAHRTLREYQTVHGTLLTQLRKTADAHRSFEESQKGKLTAVAEDIGFSVGTVVSRGKQVSLAAAGIGSASLKISTQIADCVMALQVGDSTRQRIEHANEALLIATDRLRGVSSDRQSQAADDALGIASRICRLQEIQIAGAAAEFKGEIATIEMLLSKVASSVEQMIGQNSAIATNKGAPALSFRDDVEPKLKAAEALISQFRQSRTIVDGIAVSVVSTFESLERLAASVASMAIDMTIIGTNAIVKSYRLGQRGAGLSIIAQHLRSHAVRVADGIKLLAPAMKDVREAARAFIDALEKQDAAHIAAIASRMGVVVDSFTKVGAQTTEAMRHLEKDAFGVGEVLRRAVSSLNVVVDFDDALREAAARICDVADAFDEKGASIDADDDETLGQLLRPRYTMASERVVHDAFFATSVQGTAPGRVAAAEDIDALLF